MKRFLALMTALALSFSLVACGTTDNNNNSDVIDSTNYKIGIGSYTSTESASSASGDNGKAVATTTYATVVFDSNNIIKKVYIDEVEAKVYFDSKGQIIKNNTLDNIKSKRELGDSYGMKGASPIGKEWYEQVNSLEAYLVGKNIDEISKAVMYSGVYGTKDDYASSLGNTPINSESMPNSILNGAESAIDKAAKGVENAADKITSGVESIAGNITNNSGDAIDGNNNGDKNDDNTAGGMTDNIDGKVDNSNSNSEINNNSAGNMTNDYSNAINWEQDLKSSVTINLTNIQKALQKAYANAR